MTKSFGTLLKQPPLPLDAGEYILTIDDGPNARTTPALLGILAKRCVDATFFLVGRSAQKRPDLVRSIAAGGYGIGSHSYSHADLGKLTPEMAGEEIRNGMEAVEMAAEGRFDASPRRRRLFRFPGSARYALALPPALVDLANGMGAIVAEYDASPEDWRNSAPAESFARLTARLGDRGVILLHDGQPNTIKLLPMVLDELEKRRARIVALRIAN